MAEENEQVSNVIFRINASARDIYNTQDILEINIVLENLRNSIHALGNHVDKIEYNPTFEHAKNLVDFARGKTKISYHLNLPNVSNIKEVRVRTKAAGKAKTTEKKPWYKFW